MIRTVGKLYTGASIITGTLVCIENIKNMKRSLPKSLSVNTKEDIEKMYINTLVGKSIYYGLLYPVVLVRYSENNMNDICYPLFDVNIRIYDNDYLYVKYKNSNVFNISIRMNYDSKIDIDI